MGFLKRIIGGDPQPPPWAEFFKPAEFAEFKRLVAADLARRGIPVQAGDGVVTVARPGAEPEVFGLSNLAQRCHTLDRNDWPGAIAEHFSSVLSISGRDMDALAADYDQAVETLRLRLLPDESMGGMAPIPDGPVLHAVAPGVQLALVFDFPDSTTSVNHRHLGSWPVEEEAVLADARERTLAEPLPIRERVEVPGGTAIEFLFGDSFYVASRVLGLRPLLPPDNVHGAVVGLPSRHALFWYPIEDLSTVQAIQAMIPMVAEMFRDGPGSISNQLYWWQDGDLVHLPVAMGRTGVTFTPPDAFMELLNALPAPPVPPEA